MGKRKFQVGDRVRLDVTGNLTVLMGRVGKVVACFPDVPYPYLVAIDDDPMRSRLFKANELTKLEADDV